MGSVAANGEGGGEEKKKEKNRDAYLPYKQRLFGDVMLEQS